MENNEKIYKDMQKNLERNLNEKNELQLRLKGMANAQSGQNDKSSKQPQKVEEMQKELLQMKKQLDEKNKIILQNNEQINELKKINKNLQKQTHNHSQQPATPAQSQSQSQAQSQSQPQQQPAALPKSKQYMQQHGSDKYTLIYQQANEKRYFNPSAKQPSSQHHADEQKLYQTKQQPSPVDQVGGNAEMLQPYQSKQDETPKNKKRNTVFVQSSNAREPKSKLSPIDLQEMDDNLQKLKEEIKVEQKKQDSKKKSHKKDYKNANIQIDELKQYSEQLQRVNFDNVKILEKFKKFKKGSDNKLLQEQDQNIHKATDSADHCSSPIAALQYHPNRQSPTSQQENLTYKPVQSQLALQDPATQPPTQIDKVKSNQILPLHSERYPPAGNYTDKKPSTGAQQTNFLLELDIKQRAPGATQSNPSKKNSVQVLIGQPPLQFPSNQPNSVKWAEQLELQEKQDSEIEKIYIQRAKQQKQQQQQF